MKVNRQDFLNALEEVRPAFGVSETELEQVLKGGMIHYSQNIDSILEEGYLCVERVRESQIAPRISVLMHGPRGSGKTALAAVIAKNSEFPFVKLISPEDMSGFNETRKVNHLTKVFQDAYKSPLSVVIVDDIERILDFAPIGPQFSNSVLQTLINLLCKQPPNGRRLLIIATTSQRPVLERMGLLEYLDEDIAVPNVSSYSELAHILHALQAFESPDEQRKALEELQNITGTTNLNIGIKKLLGLMDKVRRQDGDISGRFVSLMSKVAGQVRRAFDG